MPDSISIINYKGGGNLFSLQNSLDHLGIKSHLVETPEDVLKASKIIFPGVGSFAQAIRQVHALALADAITEKAKEVPLLGICVGMQVLCKSSTEAENPAESKGLNLFPYQVSKFVSPDPCLYKIPHMGWNQLQFRLDTCNPLLKNIKPGVDVYYVHSYAASVSNTEKDSDQVAWTSYTKDFAGLVWNGKQTFAAQFHPEKSGKAGLQLLKNFAEL
jgi:glutamine amidotransferase